MFTYSFLDAENPEFVRVLTIDMEGVPGAETAIKINQVENTPYEAVLKSPKILMINSAVSADELADYKQIPTRKQPVTIYLDQAVIDEFDDFKSDDDWVEFFKENAIDYEIGRSPRKYLTH